jgi:hypothetical protein
MQRKRQRGSASPNNASGIAVGLIFVALIVAIVVMVGRHGRHKQHAKLVKTKTHHIYVENDGGSTFEFVGSGGGEGPDIDLPKAGSSSIRLPPGSWVKANPPKEEDVAEEEEETVEESDAGEPEADASGDVGSESDGSGSDSGGDSGGGDSGGGDGGGGDGGE